MKKLILVALSTLSLSACIATELSTQNKAYDKTQDARVRLYGQNGRASGMEVEINGRQETITVGGGLGQAFSSMLGAKGNESIGMPETPLSKDPSAHSKILSGIFFKEFVVPAGKAVKVNNSINNLTNMLHNETLYAKTTIITQVKGCVGNVVTFVPEAGKDYEVAPISSGRQCGVTVYEIR